METSKELSIMQNFNGQSCNWKSITLLPFPSLPSNYMKPMKYWWILLTLTTKNIKLNREVCGEQETHSQPYQIAWIGKFHKQQAPNIKVTWLNVWTLSNESYPCGFGLQRTPSRKKIFPPEYWQQIILFQVLLKLEDWNPNHHSSHPKYNRSHFSPPNPCRHILPQ